MIIITLKDIKAQSPCGEGWKKLLNHLGKTKADSEPLPLETVLNSNGIEDALWCLRAVKGYDRQIRLLACAMARMTLPIYEKDYPDDMRPRRAIEASEQYVRGEIEAAALAAAADSAWAATADSAPPAAWDAGGAAAWDAAGSAIQAAALAAAGSAIQTATWVAMREKQVMAFRTFCHLEGVYSLENVGATS